MSEVVPVRQEEVVEENAYEEERRILLQGYGCHSNGIATKDQSSSFTHFRVVHSRVAESLGRILNTMARVNRNLSVMTEQNSEVKSVVAVWKDSLSANSSP